MNFTKALLTSAVLMVAAPFANASILVNGGFEANSISKVYDTFTSGIAGWNINVGSIDLIKNYWTPASGSYSIDLDGNERGEISQTFATVIGQKYYLSFDLAGNTDRGSIKDVLVEVGDQSQSYSFDVTGKNHTNMGWVSKGFTFTADGTSETLYFKSQTPGAWGVALDNVSVTPVPEPESYAMMLAGLGLMGAIARRRKSQQA